MGNQSTKRKISRATQNDDEVLHTAAQTPHLPPGRLHDSGSKCLTTVVVDRLTFVVRGPDCTCVLPLRLSPQIPASGYVVACHVDHISHNYPGALAVCVGTDTVLVDNNISAGDHDFCDIEHDYVDLPRLLKVHDVPLVLPSLAGSMDIGRKENRAQWHARMKENAHHLSTVLVWNQSLCDEAMQQFAIDGKPDTHGLPTWYRIPCESAHHVQGLGALLGSRDALPGPSADGSVRVARAQLVQARTTLAHAIETFETLRVPRVLGALDLGYTPELADAMAALEPSMRQDCYASIVMRIGVLFSSE